MKPCIGTYLAMPNVCVEMCSRLKAHDFCRWFRIIHPGMSYDLKDCEHVLSEVRSMLGSKLHLQGLRTNTSQALVKKKWHENRMCTTSTSMTWYVYVYTWCSTRSLKYRIYDMNKKYTLDMHKSPCHVIAMYWPLHTQNPNLYFPYLSIIF